MRYRYHCWKAALNSWVFSYVSVCFKSLNNTEFALLRFQTDILAWEHGEHAILSLLDHPAAFDLMDHCILPSHLYDQGGSGETALEWPKCYLNFFCWTWSSRIARDMKSSSGLNTWSVIFFVLAYLGVHLKKTTTNKRTWNLLSLLFRWLPSVHASEKIWWLIRKATAILSDGS